MKIIMQWAHLILDFQTFWGRPRWINKYSLLRHFSTAQCHFESAHVYDVLQMCYLHFGVCACLCNAKKKRSEKLTSHSL